ncbi:MAG TPA: tetratricopeptide repeat protein [Pyrinomonadaceae bacterium]|jgi:superkiller protein 3|nr:tetratricopeptide repeat protein [Pyrinomonadaceae bacterium]
MNTGILKKLAGYGLLLTIFLCFAGMANAQSKKDQKKAKQLVEEAEKAFRQKNYRSAIDNYAESIVLVPDNANAHFWKGYAHYYLKENDQALSEMDTALKLGYTPLDVYKVRWFLNFDKKNYEAALADIKEGLKLEPDNLMFLVGLAEISYSKGQYPESLAAYQKASAMQPANADIWYNIARVEGALGDSKGQSEAAEKAIKGNTRFLGDAYLMLGDSYYRQRRFDEATDAYLRALAAKPDTFEAYRNLADIYRNQNKFDDAIQISKKALLVFPNDGRIYADLSWYYGLADRSQDAIDAAQAAITFSPKEAIGYTNLCRAYNDTKQYQLAINSCNKALELSPNDGETNYYLGRAYDLLNKRSEATKYYDRAVTGLVQFTKVNSDYSDGFYLLGNAYFADDQLDNAIDAYRKCLELSPRFSRARFNLGFMLVKKKNKSAALEQYNALLTLDADLAAKLKTEIDNL